MIFATKDGKLDPGHDNLLPELTTKLAMPNAKLWLHLHGGLVTDAQGRAVADRLGGAAPEGFGLQDDWTQAYVVWRTGAFETIKTNWRDLAQNDRLYKSVLKKLIEFVAKKIGIPGEGRSAAASVKLDPADITRRISGQADKRDPFADLERVVTENARGGRATFPGAQEDSSLVLEFQAELRGDKDFNDAVADIDAVVNAKADGRTALSPGDAARGQESYDRLSERVREPIEELRPTGVAGRRGAIGVAAFLLTHGGKIALRTFRRFRNHRDHGFHATLVEEVCRELYGDLIGTTIWQMMVKDAADHFTADGFGTQLISAIPENASLRIAVSAHSAGSIWATHLIRAIKKSGKPITCDLVLLAPAVRADLFADMLTDAADRIDRCRMFTMKDELERKDAVLGHDLGYLYPSSLLYMVSGLFEDNGGKAFVDAPILGMQRFSNAPWLEDTRQQAAVAKIAAFFQHSDHAIVYSKTDGVTASDSHGGFDTEFLTLASVVKFIG